MPRKKTRLISCQPVETQKEVNLIDVRPNINMPSPKLLAACMVQGTSKVLHCKPTVPVKPAKGNIRSCWKEHIIPLSQDDQSAVKCVQGHSLETEIEPHLDVMTKEQGSDTCLELFQEDAFFEKHEITLNEDSVCDSMFNRTAQYTETSLQPISITEARPEKQHASDLTNEFQLLKDSFATENSQKIQQYMDKADLSSQRGDGNVNYVVSPQTCILTSEMVFVEGDVQPNLEISQELHNTKNSEGLSSIDDNTDISIILEEDEHSWYRALVAMELSSKESMSNTEKGNDADTKDRNPAPYKSMLNIESAHFLRKTNKIDHNSSSESRRIDQTDRRVKYLLWKENSTKLKEKITNENALKPWKPVA